MYIWSSSETSDIHIVQLSVHNNNIATTKKHITRMQHVPNSMRAVLTLIRLFPCYPLPKNYPNSASCLLRRCLRLRFINTLLVRGEFRFPMLVGNVPRERLINVHHRGADYIVNRRAGVMRRTSRQMFVAGGTVCARRLGCFRHCTN